MNQMIKYIKDDYRYYKKNGDIRKQMICEGILKALYKQEVFLVYEKYSVKNKCYSCQSLNQTGNYCNNCGQRLR